MCHGLCKSLSRNCFIKFNQIQVFIGLSKCPHTTTGISPAQLMFGKRRRMPLDELHTPLEEKVKVSQNKQANPEKKIRIFYF